MLRDIQSKFIQNVAKLHTMLSLHITKTNCLQMCKLGLTNVKV